MLMLGVFAGSALTEDAEADRMKVRRPFLNLAFGLSCFHLLCLLLTLLVYPLLPGLGNGNQRDTMEVFEVSNLFLGPIQGLVSGAIGALFFSKTADRNTQDQTPAMPVVP